MGKIKQVPSWWWSLFLAGLTISIIAVSTKFQP
jgi:hypothetical protein